MKFGNFVFKIIIINNNVEIVKVIKKYHGITCQGEIMDVTVTDLKSIRKLVTNSKIYNTVIVNVAWQSGKDRVLLILTGLPRASPSQWQCTRDDKLPFLPFFSKIKVIAEKIRVKKIPM